MIGAILGDIIGSPYEFDRGSKRKDFPLFSEESTYTDDTVMTLAVAKAFLEAQLDASDDLIMKNLADCMRQLEKCIRMPGTAEGSACGSEILSARPIIVLGMVLQCVCLRQHGYIMISTLSDTQQGFLPKLPTTIRKESRVLKQPPVLFFWQGQDTAKRKSRNILNMNLAMR